MASSDPTLAVIWTGSRRIQIRRWCKWASTTPSTSAVYNFISSQKGAGISYYAQIVVSHTHLEASELRYPLSIRKLDERGTILKHLNSKALIEAISNVAKTLITHIISLRFYNLSGLEKLETLEVSAALLLPRSGQSNSSKIRLSAPSYPTEVGP